MLGIAPFVAQYLHSWLHDPSVFFGSLPVILFFVPIILFSGAVVTFIIWEFIFSFFK